ncbi:hypothetical protein NIES23_17800 [Trichormus variabilis NIES-23]|uniref:Uncharacterized protein n=1 Tax=Trichormus variabilis NIES-23 TaxID=1973479 RepID=A0A1Z4KJ37_ANAVA|nr:hypothetical protein NIES23_17800 [Trichormus variabilis NIES-23]
MIDADESAHSHVYMSEFTGNEHSYDCSLV